MAARSVFSLHLLLLILSSYSAAELRIVNANGQRTWCVAKPSSHDQSLKENIDYACSHVDCGILRPGCPCFSPDSLINHASVAMNLYYRANGCNKWNCNFKDSGLITITDPSYDGCVYE